MPFINSNSNISNHNMHNNEDEEINSGDKLLKKKTKKKVK